MSLPAAMRRYELAIKAAGGVDGPAPPGPVGLELARARCALVLELQHGGWDPDVRVLAQLERDHARIADSERAPVV